MAIMVEIPPRGCDLIFFNIFVLHRCVPRIRPMVNRHHSPVVLRSNMAKHYYRKALPPSCIDFASQEGKEIFKEAMNGKYMDCFFNLAAQFRTQEEPAYCGLSTLVMALNALSVDPGKVWKGPWRWYHENMLDCCISLEVTAKRGITLFQFYCLAKCNGLDADLVQVTELASFDQFRDTIKRVSQCENQVLISSYSRATLGQSGDGHFSPVGGYHAGRDVVLIFDVARFKYPPHWIPVELLWKAMKGLDKQTGQPRGYMVLKQTNNTGNPTVLFKISKSFDLTFNSQLKAKQLELVRTWSAWLGTVCDEICEKREYFKKFVPKFLGLWHINNIPGFLILQIDAKLCGQLSEEHKSAICQLLDSLAKLPLFNCVEDSLKSCVDGLVSIVQKTPVNEQPCCLKMDMMFPEIKPSHFVTMMLLSWPYEMQSLTESSEVTHAKLFSQYLSEEISKTSQILKSEMELLKCQFATFFSSAPDVTAQSY